jgi:hypothetical protein
MKDSVGNEIKKGCIVRMFHFVNRYKRRKEYMYKQIGEYSEYYKRFKVWHLPIDFKELEKDAYFYMGDEFGESCVVVNSPFSSYSDRNLKRNKYLRD